MKMGSAIWHCKLKDKTNDIKEYSKPQKYILRFGYLNLQPASGYTNTILFGTKISETWILLANASIFNGVFNVGDVFYIDGNSPKLGEENGKSANAVVDYVGYQNKAIRIVLKNAEL